MATFSQRTGLVPMEKAIQLKSIDQDLRNGLWTVMTALLWSRYDVNYSYREESKQIEMLLNRIFLGLYKFAIDRIPRAYGSDNAFANLRRIVMERPWNEVYDLVDYVVAESPPNLRQGLALAFNQMLEQERSAYRFVSGELIAITDPTEITAIESAITEGARDSQDHLQRALQLFADRNAPDYRNSIKESISAVESVCKAIVGNPAATLGDALKLLKKKRTIHPQFEQALIKLYAFTNDAGGIRHALTESSVEVSSEDAKFMLVSCSGFCSYLWALAADK